MINLKEIIPSLKRQIEASRIEELNVRVGDLIGGIRNLKVQRAILEDDQRVLEEEIRRGRTTGWPLLDYFLLNLPLEELVKLAEENPPREILYFLNLEGAVKKYVGQEILFYKSEWVSTGCIDFGGHSFPTLHESWILAQIKGEDLCLESRTRYAPLTIITQGYVHSGRSGISRGGRPQFIEGNLPIYKDMGWAVGEEAIDRWRKKDPQNGKVYQELSNALSKR